MSLHEKNTDEESRLSRKGDPPNLRGISCCAGKSPSGRLPEAAAIFLNIELRTSGRGSAGECRIGFDEFLFAAIEAPRVYRVAIGYGMPYVRIRGSKRSSKVGNLRQSIDLARRMILHARVEAGACEQLVVSAALDNPATLHDENLIATDHRLQPMRHQDDRAQSF